MDYIIFLKINNFFFTSARYVIIYITTIKYLYFFTKLSKILFLKFNNNNNKIALYTCIYIQLLPNFNGKPNNKKNSIVILNNYFINKKKKKFNNILFNFFNNYFLNFLNFLLKKKLFFSIKKLNYLVSSFKKNKTILFMSKRLKRYYGFAGGFKFFKQFIDILWLSFLLKDSKFFLN